MKFYQIFILTGIIMLVISSFRNNVYGQVKDSKGYEKAFRLKLQESDRKHRARIKADSIERARNVQYHSDDALLEQLRKETASTSQVVPPNKAIKSKQPVRPFLLGGPNLGFEDGFDGYNAKLFYNLGFAFPGSYPNAFSTYEEFDLTGFVTYPQNVTSNNQFPRHLLITNKNLVDPYGGFKIIPPFGGDAVARLGNPNVGYAVSPSGGALLEAQSLSHTFTVDPANPYVVVNFAVVLQMPNHSGLNRTYFKITVQDDDSLELECATYEVWANNLTESKIPGFLKSSSGYEIYYKPWTSTILNLKDYSNQEVTITYTTGDCLAGAHWGYAYVDATTTAKMLSTKINGLEEDEICVGALVDFSSLYTGRYVNEEYEWKIYKTETPSVFTIYSERNPSISFSEPGNYTVELTIDSDGMTEVYCFPITRTFTVYSAVSAAFTVNDITPTPNQLLTFNITNHVSGNTNVITWGDGTSNTTNTTGSATHTYTRPGLYKVSVLSYKTGFPSGCSDYKEMMLDVSYLCAAELPTVSAADGSFKLDRVTGEFLFMRSSCPISVVMPCIVGQQTNTSKVIKAEVATFADGWRYNDSYTDNSGQTFPQTANEFDRGERNKWRQKSTYTYNTSLNPEDKNYRAGTYTMQNFNWRNETLNNKTRWLLGSEVTAYSPHGDPLSEKNILGIESTAKFGYNNALPYLTAKNAGSKAVFFESFENVYATGRLEDKMKVPTEGQQDDITISDNQYAHSGLHSWRFSGGGKLDIEDFKLTAAQLAKGLVVKTWIRLSNTASSWPALLNNATTNVFILKVKGKTVAPIPFKVVSRTGDWILCEASFTNAGSSVAANETFGFTIQYVPNQVIWLDDIRVQPVDAEMNCYVYDKSNLRLLAVFDDQHYGLYYQYNGEGKLIRKMIETERGVKTIQETQYNTKKITP